jgi:hypothetical protein
MRENEKRIEYDYKVGGKVLIWKVGSSAKQSPDDILNHGPLCHFIQTAQSGLPADTSLKDLIYESKTIL